MTAKEKASIHFKAGVGVALEMVIGLIEDSGQEQFTKPELLEGLGALQDHLFAAELFLTVYEDLEKRYQKALEESHDDR